MPDKRDVRLVVRLEDSNAFGDPYLKLSTEVVYFDEKDAEWVNCYGYSTPAALRGFEKLGVFAQADKYQATLYGAEVSYRDVYQAKLDDLKRMAATLTKVERKLDKMQAEFGYPKTAADVVTRFAKAVGCTGPRVFGFHDKTSPSRDDQGYVWHDADGLQYRINKAQDEFAAKYDIKREEV